MWTILFNSRILGLGFLPPDLINKITEIGSFGTGTIFGAVIFMWSEKSARKERQQEKDNAFKREQELNRQNVEKDRRIDELHKKLYPN